MRLLKSHDRGFQIFLCSYKYFNTRINKCTRKKIFDKVNMLIPYPLVNIIENCHPKDKNWVTQLF